MRKEFILDTCDGQKLSAFALEPVNSYHELHHDKDREQVREQIKSWIFNRI